MAYASCEACGAVVQRESRFNYYGAPAGTCPECGHTMFWTPPDTPADQQLVFQSVAWHRHTERLRPLDGLIRAGRARRGSRPPHRRIAQRVR